MSKLIPNLDDLRTAVPSSPAGEDAAELVAGIEQSSTWAEVDAALDEVVARWATP